MNSTTSPRHLHLAGLLALAAALALFVLPAASRAGEPAEPAKAADAPLVRVESQRVCMVNDRVFDRDQIPVEVAGKTYYGCCAMCKARLAEDPVSRTGKDPVSGKAVDKAAAVTAALADGTVLYFETEKSFETYRARLAEQDEKAPAKGEKAGGD